MGKECLRIGKECREAEAGASIIHVCLPGEVNCKGDPLEICVGDECVRVGKERREAEAEYLDV